MFGLDTSGGVNKPLNRPLIDFSEIFSSDKTSDLKTSGGGTRNWAANRQINT